MPGSAQNNNLHSDVEYRCVVDVSKPLIIRLEPIEESRNDLQMSTRAP